MLFKDRTDAAEQLVRNLEPYADKDCIVYALPRGGVVLGAVISRQLNAPLDLLTPRKVGHPHQPEFAIAAVTAEGTIVTTDSEQGVVDEGWLKTEILAQQAEARRRRQAYLGDRQYTDIGGRTAIIVDDGVATGLTLKAAIKDLFRHSPAEIIVAVPVIPSDVAEEIEHMVDRIVALDIPQHYAGAVSAYYNDFGQVSDEEVARILSEQ